MPEAVLIYFTPAGAVDTAGLPGMEAQPGDIDRALDEARAAGGEVA